jgi:hypothetical protein
MQHFDPQAIILAARQASPPADWRLHHVQRAAAIWDLLARLVAAVALLAVCALLLVGARSGAGDGAVPYVFAAFAFGAGVAYLIAAWTPLRQVRRPDDYLLVLVPDGIALAWSGRTLGLSYAVIADVTLRRRSFRAIFGQDLALVRDDGQELVLPLGDLFGEPAEILTTVIAGVRRARGAPPAAAD